MKTNLFLAASIAAFLSGCGGGSTPAPEAEATISGIATPENVVVIQEAAASANLAAVNYAAFNDTGTDYANTIADSWIDGGDWQEPFATADDLACIMTATGAGTHPNEKYLALVEHSTCMPDGSAPGQINWAEAIMDTSRADNNSPELVKAYYTMKAEDGSDATIVADVKAVAAPTESNPWGEWDINYDFKNWNAGTYDYGAFSIVKEGSDLNFKFNGSFNRVEQSGYSWDWDSNWANGIIKADRSGGQVQVSLTQGWNDGTEKVYKVDFNTTHASVSKDGSAAICQSLTSFTEYAYDYNIYTEEGAAVDITSTLELVFGTNKDKKAWAWIEETGSSTASSPNYRHRLWTEDGTKPEIVYLKDDTSVSKNVTWTGWIPNISDIDFTPPINFANNHINNTEITNDLTYYGMNRLYGINWSKVGNKYRPNYSLSDGTQLTAENGTIYRVKRTRVAKTPNPADGQCSGLDTSTISFSNPELTNTAKDITWSTKPTVSSEAKVIHGVDQ